MKVSMPRSQDVGWGIAGTYLSQKMSHLPALEDVTLHSIRSHAFKPYDQQDWNSINIGYCFFEHEVLAYHFLPTQKDKWDFIVAGSHWCEYQLRLAGVRHTTTILQGVDGSVFHPIDRPFDDGRFIVFSGGKFEFRKGQDLVIEAMKIFMARHGDVWLSCAWHNHWPNSIATMEQSRIINFKYKDLPCDQLMAETLAANGIDTSRVIINPRLNNHQMAAVYANSDLGLYPIRCEGGNNMVMSEYMACGRPVVASNWSGHADVITSQNAFELNPVAPVICRYGGNISGVWFETSVEQILEQLEIAYSNRELLRQKGAEAARITQKLDWQQAAEQFYAIGRHLSGKKSSVGVQVSRPAYSDDAEALFNAGRFKQAETVWRKQLATDPLNPELYNCLGTVLSCQGLHQQAQLYYTKAVGLAPDQHIFKYNLANTLKATGRQAEAREILEQVVVQAPGFTAAWKNLAAIYNDQKEYLAAINCLNHVLQAEPDNAGCLSDLAYLHSKTGNNPRLGLQYAERALKAKPEDATLLNSYGRLLYELDRFQESIDVFMKGLAIKPQEPYLLGNLGNSCLALKEPEKAVYYYNLALQQQPGETTLLTNRGFARLMQGDYQRGWQDYEARFNKEEKVKAFNQDLPRWRGEEISGKTLLVWAEQVYGDTIQFARFIPYIKTIAGSGVKLVFESLDYNQTPLFKNFNGIDQVYTRGEPRPAADYQVPLLSLAGIVMADSNTIPTPEGYLKADPDRKEHWCQLLNSLGRGDKPKIGLVWGGRKPRLNANRSMELQHLLPLFDAVDANWFSLQLGDDRQQLQQCDNPVIDLADYLTNFGEAAAAVSNLDLLISIDTATAHLAGALGVPVWVMLKLSADWRWLRNRSDNPWYSSARLFRQKDAGDWQPVVAEVGQQLKGAFGG